jgi:uncharacterized protein YbjT (DUF2867 family)
MRLAVAGGTGTVGRYVAAVAGRRGHEVVVLSRSAGVDLATGAGLAGAMAGVEAVVDVSNIRSLDRDRATAYFIGATRRLQQAGAQAGARQLVVLSIVGVDRVPGFGYYQAKLAHEQAALDGSFPTTVLRATQFHEFAGQVVERAHLGPLAVVPRMRCQPVAARTVGEALVDLAEAEPAGRVGELGGPEVLDMVTMARRLAARRGSGLRVVAAPLPGTSARAMRSGALLPGPGARLQGPGFGEWLQGEDAVAVVS